MEFLQKQQQCHFAMSTYPKFLDGKLDQLGLLLQVVDLQDDVEVASDAEAEWVLVVIVVVVVKGPGLPGRRLVQAGHRCRSAVAALPQGQSV